MEAIRTAHLLIRPFARSDLDDFLAYQSDPAVRRHLPGEPHTPAEAARFLTMQSVLDDEARDTWHDWAIEHVADAKVVGNVGVFLPASERTSADLGFQLHPGYQGQGLASEAAGALVQHLGRTLGLTTVTASCDVENERSARVLLGLGFLEVVGREPVSRSFELRVGSPDAPGHRPAS